MPLCQIQWGSKVLGKQLETNVILPEVGEGPFPVFYLLHGLSDNHTAWQRWTRIEAYVRQLPLIVVMPDGFRGFYTNCENGPDYAEYMVHELPAFIERNFPAISAREARCVGGLSMGGYGAMRLALGFPDVFCSATSHSGALAFGHHKTHGTKYENSEFEQIIGKDPRGSEHDLFALAERCLDLGKLPKLRIDCGTEDFLLDQNREFIAYLKQEGIPHEYEEFPGDHNWGYWDQHVQEALSFHCRNLGIE